MKLLTQNFLKLHQISPTFRKDILKLELFNENLNIMSLIVCGFKISKFNQYNFRLNIMIIRIICISSIINNKSQHTKKCIPVIIILIYYTVCLVYNGI